MRNYGDFAKKSLKKDKNNGDLQFLWFDREMESFEMYYDMKRRELEAAKGSKRVRNNKYFTCLDC